MAPIATSGEDTAMGSITTKIAAGTTLAALGGLAGMAVRPEHAATADPAAAPVEVRTQVIRRTVRIVRHERPRHRAHRTAPGVGAPAPAAPAAPAPAQPVTFAAKPPAAPKHSEPLRTRTSGGKSGHGGDDGGEHEGHDD
jgi:hypothetical protein